MRVSIKLALGASILGLAAPAGAATFFFSSGAYNPGVTSPNPLLAPDVLEIGTVATKSFATDFTNQSGTVNWRDGGAILLGGGAAVTNGGSWYSFANQSMSLTTGGGTFFNTGLFANAGAANTTIFNVLFDNTGIIDAATGIIRYNAGGIFRDGSQYLGAGTVSINSNSSFLGNQNSDSLSFDGGTFTGTGAILNGSADWTAGTFTGDWTVSAGAQLNALGGATRTFGAGTFVNDGTLSWQASSTALFGGDVEVTNNGLLQFNANANFQATTGGGTLFNAASGEIAAAAGTTVNIGIPLINQGGLLTADGIINYGSSGQQFLAGSTFTGSGANRVNTNALFAGAINSDNLELRGGQYQGSVATLNGTTDWHAGNFEGGWTLANGATLTALGGATRAISNGTFVNDGDIVWQNASSLLFGGGSTLTNNETLQFLANGSFQNTTGGGTLVNAATGTIATAAGTSFTLGISGFINQGGIIASDGLIDFNTSGQTFNDGTQFTGSGASRINANAIFSDAFTSANLELRTGTFSGNAAELNGSVDWYAGTFSGDWTVANGAQLNALGGATRAFVSGTMANDGAINWDGTGTGLFGGGFTLTNNGVLDFDASANFSNTTGGGALINSATGLLDVAAGETFNIAISQFTNNGGQINADGIINFGVSNQQFNAGTTFTGLGESRINTNAGFSDGFTSQNLVFNGGVFTGFDAALSGTAEWRTGTFSGEWTIAGDGILTSTGGATRSIVGGSFVNAGNLVIEGSGTVLFGGSAAVVNTGTIDFQENSTFGSFTTGGGSLVNNGLIEKSGGAGTTTLLPNGELDNNGTMNVTSGILALPGNFANDGTMAGTASYQVGGATGLTNNGTIAPGDLGLTGTLGLTGNYVQTVAGTLSTQLASTSMFDLFNISGTAALDGTLALSCIMGCSISTGDVFTILNSGGALSGIFSNVTTSGFLDGFSYDVIYDYANSEVRLSILNSGMAPPVGGVPEPATWALMILGFGFIGGSLRRRSAKRVQLVLMS